MRTCDQCQHNNAKLHKHHEPLHPIKVKGEAWHQVGMDLIGPLQEMSCDNKYIMTLTDKMGRSRQIVEYIDAMLNVKENLQQNAMQNREKSEEAL